PLRRPLKEWPNFWPEQAHVLGADGNDGHPVRHDVPFHHTGTTLAPPPTTAAPKVAAVASVTIHCSPTAGSAGNFATVTAVRRPLQSRMSTFSRSTRERVSAVGARAGSAIKTAPLSVCRVPAARGARRNTPPC